MSLAVHSGNTQWYECHCDLGQIWVGVVVGEALISELTGPLKVMRQATLLADVELVLQALELWQNIDLDLYPIDPPAESTTTNTIHVTLTHKEAPDYYPVRFELPAPMLHRLKPVDAELTRVLELSWSALGAQLVLDQFSVPEHEEQALQPGAVALLPQSFADAWQARLVVPTIQNCVFTGVLEVQAGSFKVSGPCSDKTAESVGQLSVRLRQSIMLTADILLGESGGVPVPLELDQSALQAVLCKSGNPVGSGTIGPVGTGHALFIDSMTPDVMLEIA